MTRDRLHQIIFEADTPKGKTFDIVLLIAILLSVLVVMLESVGSIEEKYGALLLTLEWVFTILFTIEYVNKNKIREINRVKKFFGRNNSFCFLRIRIKELRFIFFNSTNFFIEVF